MTQNPGSVVATVAIPNWNGLPFLKQCIHGLRNQSLRDFQILVVDNGSSDGSQQWLSAQKDIEAIYNRHNLGFAAANNQALAAARGRVFVTLNNDTLPDARFLETLITTLDTDPQLGSAAAVMVWSHKPKIVASAGIDFHKDGTATDHMAGMPLDAVQGQEVFGASAGAAGYRTEVLQSLGGFQEDYFAYLEDADLAWLMRLRGYGCQVAKDAIVSHAYSATLGSQSATKRFLISRNRIRLIVRCIPTRFLAKWWPYILRYELMALAEGLAKGDWPRIRGRLSALSQFPRLVRQRSTVQARIRVDLDFVERLIQPPLSLREALRIHYKPETALP